MVTPEDDQSQDACGPDDFPVETVGAAVGCRIEETGFCVAQPSDMGYPEDSRTQGVVM